MVLLTAVILGIASLCQADIRWSGDTILVPGRIKNPKALAAANLCCISVNGGCCASSKPVCQPSGCCATGTTECANDPRTCKKPGETCCGNGYVCPSTKPVCSGGLCCPKDTTLCLNDPTICKELDEQCCGGGSLCPVWASCCGTGACCDPSNPEISQCCKGSSADKDTCCGEYEVCCDGWCCPESSTCSSTPGYCNVPVLEFGYVPNNIISDLVENTCLGIRRQIALGRPETTPNQQILTYYGPGSPNRELSDCRSSRGCCTGRTVPAGEPGAGDKATCDEYPFNSAIEGGADAHVACVDEHANSGGGDLIGQMVSGKHRGFKYALRVTGIDCTTVQESDVHGCNPAWEEDLAMPATTALMATDSNCLRIPATQKSTMATLSLSCGLFGRLRRRKRPAKNATSTSPVAVAPPAAPVQGPINLETLPAELRCLILGSIEELEDLKALVFASPVYHAQYLSRRIWFLRRILQNTLGNGNVLADAYATHASGLLRKNGPRSCTHPETLRLFMMQYSAHRSAPPEQLWTQTTTTEADPVGMAAFYLGVARPLLQPCATMFFTRLCSSLPVGPLSRTERTRLLRALYRYQTYCNLFGMGTTGEIKPVDVAKEERLMKFFCWFSPWEIQEIECIYILFRDKYEALFDVIKDDVAKDHPRFQGSERPWAPLGSFDLTSPYQRSNLREGTASRGLQSFLQVLQATEHEALVAAMQQHMTSHIDFMEDAMTWSAQNRRRHLYHPSPEDDAQRRRDPMPFLGDREGEGADAPPLAWVIMWRGQYKNEFGYAVKDRFKKWGLQILRGFHPTTGAPILEDTPNTPITLRHLLTHTVGLAYDIADPDITKWSAWISRTDTNLQHTLAGWTTPLKFTPGQGWQYGTAIDWAGQLVERITGRTLGAYLEETILRPLGMADTTLHSTSRPNIDKAGCTRRDPVTRSLEMSPLPVPLEPPVESAGAGLWMTARDHARMLQALLAISEGGEGGGVLKRETVDEMFRPQLDEVQRAALQDTVGRQHDTMMPEFPPGTVVQHGMGGIVNVEDVPGKRRAGSMQWMGMANSHWWIDRATGIAATLIVNIDPFPDDIVIKLYDELERAVYGELLAELRK
ncbi:hypothetical protein F5144DRAFT_596461 [Chaetomium tenue]|uniref:Uncharacterized protein n=1 Tax=Chaetomium tenue TaxID=1854479 RepID=A0ACB7NVC0_9PEZI|nr:hypothetical protein F5144DRAFT_596461 [Chaetomium globosum]